MNLLLNHPPPASGELRIITEFTEGYKIWHNFFVNLPRHTRFTIGAKIDNCFTECLRLSLLAGYSPRGQKHLVVGRLSSEFDALKFFLKILWEIEALEDQQYIHLSTPLAKIGKMIGMWQKDLKTSG